MQRMQKQPWISLRACSGKPFSVNRYLGKKFLWLLCCVVFVCSAKTTQQRIILSKFQIVESAFFQQFSAFNDLNWIQFRTEFQRHSFSFLMNRKQNGNVQASSPHKVQYPLRHITYQSSFHPHQTSILRHNKRKQFGNLCRAARLRKYGKDFVHFLE